MSCSTSRSLLPRLQERRRSCSVDLPNPLRATPSVSSSGAIFLNSTLRPGRAYTHDCIFRPDLRRRQSRIDLLHRLNAGCDIFLVYVDGSCMKLFTIHHCSENVDRGAELIGNFVIYAINMPVEAVELCEPHLIRVPSFGTALCC